MKLFVCITEITECIFLNAFIPSGLPFVQYQIHESELIFTLDLIYFDWCFQKENYNNLRKLKQKLHRRKTLIFDWVKQQKSISEILQTIYYKFNQSYILVAPVSVLIVNKGDQLVVGESSDIVCRSSGSRPPAHITWYLDEKRIDGGTESVSCIFSISSSYVHLILLWDTVVHFHYHCTYSQN